MAVRIVTELERLLGRLENRATPLDSQWREDVAREIGKLFRVQPDEVAVLQLSRTGKVLKFVLPEKLQAVGSIPLTSTTALAARTARERRADAVNNFALSPAMRSSLKGVPLGQRQNESIQKIMSVPILRGDEVIGVARNFPQGPLPSESGPDFSTKDLTELQGMNALFGRFLALHSLSAS